mmetsp:Transcript_4736/g.14166  ORF Transcript_4736/g.14166 Transcript_4736/m.14166 type:complete len:243 (-) Transcript_4736:395-1123(-)
MRLERRGDREGARGERVEQQPGRRRGRRRDVRRMVGSATVQRPLPQMAGSHPLVASLARGGCRRHPVGPREGVWSAVCRVATSLLPPALPWLRPRFHRLLAMALCGRGVAAVQPPWPVSPRRPQSGWEHQLWQRSSRRWHAGNPARHLSVLAGCRLLRCATAGAAARRFRLPGPRHRISHAALPRRRRECGEGVGCRLFRRADRGDLWRDAASLRVAGGRNGHAPCPPSPHSLSELVAGLRP